MLIRIMSVLLLVFAFGWSQTTTPVTPVAQVSDPRLIGRIDSLALELNRAQMKSEAIIQENKNLRDLFWDFSKALVGLFVGAMGILTLFIWKRSADEREFIAAETVKLVTPILEPKISTLAKTIKDNKAEYDTVIKALLNYNSNIEPKIAKTALIDDMKSRLLSLEIAYNVDEYKISSDKIDKHIEDKILDKAYSLTITAIERIRKINTVGIYGALLQKCVDRLVTIFRQAKYIRQDVRTNFDSYKKLFSDTDWQMLTKYIDLIPIKKSDGLLDDLLIQSDTI